MELGTPPPSPEREGGDLGSLAGGGARAAGQEGAAGEGQRQRGSEQEGRDNLPFHYRSTPQKVPFRKN